MKFYTEFIDMIIISHHTKFHMSSSSGSSVIIIEPEAKCTFYTSIMLFYIPQNFKHKKPFMIFELILWYIVSGSYY